MAISFVNSASTSTNSTSLSLTMPTIAAGDVALYVATRVSTSGGWTASPSGFTLISNQVNGSSSYTSVWYKVLAGTESASSFTATWGTTSRAAAAMVIYRGVDSSAFDATTVSSIKGTASTSTTFDGITTATDGAWIVRLVSGRASATSTAALSFTPPTSPTETERVDVSTSGSAVVQIAIECNDFLKSPAGVVASDSTGTINRATFDAEWTIALKPSTSSATTGSGALTLTGAASAVGPILVSTGAASIALTGSASVNLVYPVTAAGAVEFSGSMVTANPTTGAGVVTLTGSASVGLSFASAGSAALTLTGSASPTLSFGTVGSGALALAATASVALKYATNGAGALTLTGSATGSLSYPTTGSGALTLTGNANTGSSYPTTGSGALSLTGSANVGLSFASTGSAALALVGAATTSGATPAGFIGWGIPI